MRTSLITLTLALIAVASLTAGHASEAALRASSTVISGGALPAPVRLAVADEDAFVRRTNVPPKLDVSPRPAGQPYVVKSAYWAQVLPGHDGVRPPAAEAAEYYPEGGLVRARQGADDSWLVLDLRQRAIIDRYVRLGERGDISGEPGILEVLRGDANLGATIGVDVNGWPLTPAERSRLWLALAETKPASTGGTAVAVSPPRDLPAGEAAWLTFTMPEGRTLQLLFLRGPGALVDYVGGELYPAPANLLSEALLPKGNPEALTATEVPQHEGSGSPLWWVLMVGAGLALVAGGVLLGRRSGWSA